MATAGRMVFEGKIAIDIILAEDGKYYVDLTTTMDGEVVGAWTDGPLALGCGAGFRLRSQVEGWVPRDVVDRMATWSAKFAAVTPKPDSSSRSWPPTGLASKLVIRSLPKPGRGNENPQADYQGCSQATRRIW